MWVLEIARRRGRRADLPPPTLPPGARASPSFTRRGRRRARVRWTRMRILVTNDDGVDVARDQSPRGRARRRRPRRARGRARPRPQRQPAPRSDGCTEQPIPAGRATTWARAPDVAVHAHRRAAGHRGLRRRASAPSATRPDLVASGINPGANTGHLVLHSGTVGAALTGGRLGIPGSRCSLDVERETRVPLGHRGAVRASPRSSGSAEAPTATAACSTSTCPNRPFARGRAASARPSSRRTARCGSRRPTCRGGDLQDRVHRDDADAAPGTDVALVSDGYASVTPLLGIVAAPLDGSRRTRSTNAWRSSDRGMTAVDSRDRRPLDGRVPSSRRHHAVAVGQSHPTSRSRTRTATT